MSHRAKRQRCSLLLSFLVSSLFVFGALAPKPGSSPPWSPSSAEAADSLNIKGKWTYAAKSLWDVLTGDEVDPLEVRLQSGGATHMALLRGTADCAWIIHLHRGHTARLWLVDSLSD